jgi:hypothetical protein
MMIGNEDWRLTFPNGFVCVLPRLNFLDHHTLLLCYVDGPSFTFPQMMSENHIVRIENYTIFVDANYFSNGSTSWGLVAYDQPNSIYISACRKENIEIDPLIAEVLGILRGLQTAKNSNWQTVTIMSDAEVVVKCINSKVYVAAIYHIVQDCRELLLALQSTNVMFVKCDLNVVAHNLVNLSKLVGCRT